MSEVTTSASGSFELPVTTLSDYELTVDGVWSTGIRVGANGLSAGELVLPGRVDTTVIRVEDTNGVGVEGVDVDVTQQGSVTLSPALGTFNRFTAPIHVVTGVDGNVVVPGLYDTTEMSVWASTNYKATQRNRFGSAGGTVLTVVPAEPPSVVVTGLVSGPVSYVALSPLSGSSTAPPRPLREPSHCVSRRGRPTSCRCMTDMGSGTQTSARSPRIAISAPLQSPLNAWRRP